MNNDRIPENQITMLQTLQKQMEKIHQKSIKDRQKKEEKVRLRKEQNEELRRMLTKSACKQQSPPSEHTQNQEKTITVRTQTHQRTLVIEEEDDPKGHHRCSHASTTPSATSKLSHPSLALSLQPADHTT